MTDRKLVSNAFLYAVHKITVSNRTVNAKGMVTGIKSGQSTVLKRQLKINNKKIK